MVVTNSDDVNELARTIIKLAQAFDKAISDVELAELADGQNNAP
jgi:hypothetical protein